MMKIKAKIFRMEESEFMQMPYESFLQFGKITSANCQHCKDWNEVDYFGKCRKCGRNSGCYDFLMKSETKQTVQMKTDFEGLDDFIEEK